jgi:hypothetical protein
MRFTAIAELTLIASTAPRTFDFKHLTNVLWFFQA